MIQNFSPLIKKLNFITPIELTTFQAYYSGQVIDESIQITVTEPKWYQYVAVHLYGKGKVHWTETEYTGSGDNR